MSLATYDPWPSLPYDAFSETRYLLHMAVQIIGKLKLTTPFESHFANAILLPTSTGVSSGLIPYKGGFFSFEMDFIHHEVAQRTSWGDHRKFALQSSSVAEIYHAIFDMLRKAGISLSINPVPQELLSTPIPFDQDTKQKEYNEVLANAWWRILLSSYHVMLQYHAKFHGESPPVGLMWGTFDLRDARYNGIPVAATGINSGYIRRNAMNEQQVEAGWWPGNELYPRAAYYSFTYPEPNGIDQAQVKPNQTHFDTQLREFIIDYDDIRRANDPEKTLLEFFESTYQVGVLKAGWKQNYLVDGKPI